MNRRWWLFATSELSRSRPSLAKGRSCVKARATKHERLQEIRGKHVFDTQLV